jgi:hypothetical protein
MLNVLIMDEGESNSHLVEDKADLQSLKFRYT